MARREGKFQTCYNFPSRRAKTKGKTFRLLSLACPLGNRYLLRGSKAGGSKGWANTRNKDNLAGVENATILGLGFPGSTREKRCCPLSKRTTHFPEGSIPVNHSVPPYPLPNLHRYPGCSCSTGSEIQMLCRLLRSAPPLIGDTGNGSDLTCSPKHKKAKPVGPQEEALCQPCKSSKQQKPTPSHTSHTHQQPGGQWTSHTWAGP